MGESSVMSWLGFACVCVVLLQGTECLGEAGWITVVRCQSSCARKFLQSPASDSGCDLDAGCTMCWRMCEKLYTSHEAWRHVCNAQNDFICPPGCRAACNFTELHDEDAQILPTLTFDPIPAFLAVGHSQLVIGWTSPVSRSGQSPEFLVYALFWRHRETTDWIYLCSTLEHLANVDGSHYVFTDVAFKLVAVVSEGITAVTTPVYPPPGYTPPTDVDDDYYDDESEYDYEDYEDEHLPIRPSSRADRKPPEPQPETPPSSGQLGTPEVAAPVPDLKIAVNVDVTVGTNVQALVTWTQPMDIRPTSYKVRWDRVSCQVAETEAPGCGLRSEQVVASIKATVEPLMTYGLASLTFNSEYWVEVSIDGLITQRVIFYTPACNLTVDSTLTNCSLTPTVDYQDETQPPPTVSGPAVTTKSNYGSTTTYVTIAVWATVALLVVVTCTTIFKKRVELRQLIVSNAHVIRSCSIRTKSPGCYNTCSPGPTATVAVGGLTEADGGAPGAVRDVLLGQGDGGHTTEAGELTGCLSDSIVFMDSTDSGTEEMADGLCQELGDTLDADRKCRIDMCGACDSTDV